MVDRFGNTLEQILEYSQGVGDEMDLFLKSIKKAIADHRYTSSPAELVMRSWSVINPDVTKIVVNSLHPKINIDRHAATHWESDSGFSADKMEDFWMKTRMAISRGNVEFVKFALPRPYSYDDDGSFHPLGEFLIDEYQSSSDDQIKEAILNHLTTNHTSIHFSDNGVIRTGLPLGDSSDLHFYERHLDHIRKLSEELPGWSKEEAVNFTKKFNEMGIYRIPSDLMTAKHTIKATGGVNAIKSRIIRILELDAQFTSQELDKHTARLQLLRKIAG